MAIATSLIRFLGRKVIGQIPGMVAYVIRFMISNVQVKFT